MLRSSRICLLLGLWFGMSQASSPAEAQRVSGFDPAVEESFMAGMRSYEARDYRRAEDAFRRILDRDPSLLRVRLELARTLYMQKKDAEADYHFGLAAAKHPAPQVLHNILRFREAIRARRAWRFNFDF